MTRPKHLPENLPLKLDDGREVRILRHKGSKMICRQLKTEKGERLREGELVLTQPWPDGTQHVLKVLKWKKRNVILVGMGAAVPLEVS